MIRFLDQHDFEYYTFRKNTDRIEGLAGIIRSPAGNELIRSILTTNIKDDWYGFRE
jgi:hypothetical protein